MDATAIAAQQTAPPSTQGSRYRPLLLALAVIFAAASTAYSAAWIYFVEHPISVEVGMDADPFPTGLQVKDVWQDSPARSAGLRDGDIIVSIDGQSVAPPANGLNVLYAIWHRSHPGETVYFTVKRAGEPQPISISPVFRQAAGPGDSLARRGAVHVLLLYPVLFLVVGMAVLFLRLEDRNAWLLALLFAGFIGIGSVDFSAAPAWLQPFVFFYIAMAGAFLPGLFYFFFAVFPTRSPIDRKLPWLKWLLLAVGASLRFGDVLHGSMEALPFLTRAVGRPSIGLIRTATGYGTVVLGVISLVLNIVNVKQVDERRKLKVMLWGALIGLIPALVIGLPYDLYHQRPPFWLGFIQGTALLFFPLSFAYAVVKHRVMDVPVLLRRSARYFLVERGFAILILLISVTLTLWFGQAFSRRFSAGSRAAIPIGATFGVVLISGAIQVHRRVRTRLDRAFFRSAYDAQQILETLAATALMVTDRAALAALLHRHIHEALHPMPLVIYLLAPDGQLQAYAGHPPSQALTLSPGVAELDGLAERSAALEVDPDSLRGTPLEPLRAECLVPIRGSSDGGLQGVTVLGPRLSDEPYSAQDKRLLASVASQAGIAMRSISLAEKMAERMEAERRAQQEMDIARQVQSRLLPQQAPALVTLECAGRCIQTRAVGGDYYDFLDFGSGRLGLVLTDISGKGISSALLMANFQASLRGQYALALEDLPGLLRSVNRLFYRNTEPSHYATTFFAIYDDQSRTLRYVNCGHNPPILLRAGGEVERLDATAMVLGLFEQWDCSVADRRLAPGDMLLIYTDGISEAAAGEDAEEFGEERLIHSARAHCCKPAEQTLAAILADVQQFSQGEQADDMTMIVAKCR